MNDRSTQDSTAALTEGHAQRPERLTQAREAAGLHIAALAAALKVPVKKLEALEAGRYSELPDLVFARALASSACRQLKVDPAPVLAQIPASLVPQLGDALESVNTPFKSASAGGVGARSDGWLSRPAVLAALGLVLAALVLVFLPDMSTPTPPVSSAPVAEAAREPATPQPLEPVPTATAAVPAPVPAAIATPAPAPMPTPAPVPAPASAPAAVPAGVPAASTSAPVAVPAPTPVATPTAVGAAVADSKKVLFIRATGESWVQVVDGAGAVLIQRMFKAGDVVDFSATPPYQVVLGRVDSAEVWVRGQAFDATPFARNSVARFEVK
jgi:cytoskeleton protein RodZ